MVDAQPHLGALALAQPAYAGGQALERDAFLRHLDPARQALVLGEEFQDRPIRRGDAVLVGIPDGDGNAGPIILARLASTADAVPTTVNDRATDGSFAYDVVDADVEEESTTGQWRRRAATIAALDGQATAGVLLGFAASQRVVRGDAYTNAESAFLAALNTFAAAVGTAVGSIPVGGGGAAAGAAITTAARPWPTSRRAASTWPSGGCWP